MSDPTNRTTEQQILEEMRRIRELEEERRERELEQMHEENIRRRNSDARTVEDVRKVWRDVGIPG